MRLIINADDFGYSRSINEGIIYAHKKGLISSTSIMVNMPFAKHAINLWKGSTGGGYYRLGLGVHLNITKGPAVLKERSTLTDEDNIFTPKDFENEEFSYSEAYNEMKAQIEETLAYADVDHLNYHDPLLTKNANLVKVVVDLAKEYNLPLRNDSRELEHKAKEAGVKIVAKFKDSFYGDKARAQTILDIIESSDDSIMEIMTHVGFIDKDTKKVTSYLDREQEIEALKEAKELGYYDKFELISFTELRNEL